MATHPLLPFHLCNVTFCNGDESTFIIYGGCLACHSDGKLSTKNVYPRNPLFSRAFNVTMYHRMQLFTLNIKLKLVNRVNRIMLSQFIYLCAPKNSCYSLLTWQANEIDFDDAFQFSFQQIECLQHLNLMAGKLWGKLLTLFVWTCKWIQMKGLQDLWTDLNANIFVILYQRWKNTHNKNINKRDDSKGNIKILCIMFRGEWKRHLRL